MQVQAVPTVERNVNVRADLTTVSSQSEASSSSIHFPKGDFFRHFPVPLLREGLIQRFMNFTVMDFSQFVSPKAGYDPAGWKSQLYPNEIARNS